jgi:hypothetical protein
MGYIGNKPAQATIPADDAVTTAMLKDDAVTSAKIAGTTIVNADINASAAISNSKLETDPTNASNLSSGSVPLAQLGNVDTTGIQTDIALLGFKVAANGSLSKYDLVDQTIDAFEDATGVDASASTGETRNASNYYAGSATVTPTVTGGTITTDGAYKVHTFASNGTYDSDATQTVDIMVVGGGGAGGRHGGAGGGSGGMVYTTGYSLDDSAHTITVGAKGIGASGTSNTAGADSSVGSLLTGKGGGKGVSTGNNPTAAEPYNGGCGGGSGASTKVFTQTQTSQSGVSGSDGFGSNGGTGYDGGAAGSGGNGKSVSISGAAVTYGGGGGGSYHETDFSGGGGGGIGAVGGNASAGTSTGSGGSGGGGSGNAGAVNGGNATAYGSGGGGGGKDCVKGGDGYAGVVIIRRPVTSDTYNDMTLISNATTAEAVATKGDLVMTYTDGAGTAVVNTDIKGWVSRDNGANYTQFTLTDDGTTGGHTILTDHDLDISAQPSGTSMRYKITTHNQSAAKQTRIQAVSLGWS